FAIPRAAQGPSGGRIRQAPLQMQLAKTGPPGGGIIIFPATTPGNGIPSRLNSLNRRGRTLEASRTLRSSCSYWFFHCFKRRIDGPCRADGSDRRARGTG